ncbi:Hypothetical predicted protein [Paramuricea clavata]|uniref:Uncharacterized protein n=1 Tax=Paramuricea clavata TaxID=317549 RepID=A0A7D9HQD9_PARCT|nr:Hypothetical predicted protein [Paramuricea clavata]
MELLKSLNTDNLQQMFNLVGLTRKPGHLMKFKKVLIQLQPLLSKQLSKQPSSFNCSNRCTCKFFYACPRFSIMNDTMAIKHSQQAKSQRITKEVDVGEVSKCEKRRKARREGKLEEKKRTDRKLRGEKELLKRTMLF